MHMHFLVFSNALMFIACFFEGGFYADFALLLLLSLCFFIQRWVLDSRGYGSVVCTINGTS
jgi:hypothetical protein